MATSRSFSQFRRRIALRAKQFGEGVETKMRRAAIKADQTLVFRTPFDTGRAKSNWLVSLDSPVLEELPVNEVGNKEAAERIALDQGLNTIGQFKSPRNSAIFISNSVPYIEKLDNGSSAQAPEGFSQLAIQAAQTEFQQGNVFKGR